jgi:hypothetical protein
MLGEAIAAVRDGTMDVRVGSALASLADALVRTVEASELEQRLLAVERYISCDQAGNATRGDAS